MSKCGQHTVSGGMYLTWRNNSPCRRFAMCTSVELKVVETDSSHYWLTSMQNLCRVTPLPVPTDLHSLTWPAFFLPCLPSLEGYVSIPVAMVLVTSLEWPSSPGTTACLPLSSLNLMPGMWTALLRDRVRHAVTPSSPQQPSHYCHLLNYCMARHTVFVKYLH